MFHATIAVQGVEGKGRKRAENWQNGERDYLFELIREHVSVIENKKTDAGISRKKNVNFNM